MKLAEVLSIYSDYLLGEYSSKDVRSICIDSRAVESGSLFIAVSGTESDGHKFIASAIEAGAIGVVCEKTENIPDDYVGAVVKVDDSRLEAARISAKYHGEPANELFCIGVTGTNGKTSITYMVEHILNEFGWPTGVLGTIDHHLKEHKWNSQLTTPDPVTLQRRLQEMKALDAKAAIFEVSSHAIIQKRAHGIPLDVGIFTNLTRDHLDYHNTTEEYFKAKESLFSEILPMSTKLAKTAVVNSDDSYGRQIQLGPGVKRKTFGSNPASDYQIFIDEMSFAGTQYRVKLMKKDYEGSIPQVGKFFVYNTVAAIAACVEAGVSMESAMDSMKSFRGVPGRLQRVSNEKGVHVFVDYAHTDDALRSVLKSLVEIRSKIQSSGQIICVFGCGGDRDPGKRPLMMSAAMEHSDLVYVTSDNPRTEDPNKIISEITSVVPEAELNHSVFIEPDRAEAIKCAINMAKPEDIVIIAGKGHEDYQIIGKDKVHFDDVEVAQECLAK